MLKINLSRSFAMSLAYLLYCFGARKCPRHELHTISCLCKYVWHAWSVRWHHTTKWKKACKALKQFIWSWKPPCSRSLFYLLYHDCTIKDLHLTCRHVSGVCTCHHSSCTSCCHACNIGTWSSSENKVISEMEVYVSSTFCVAVKLVCSMMILHTCMVFSFFFQGFELAITTSVASLGTFRIQGCFQELLSLV